MYNSTNFNIGSGEGADVSGKNKLKIMYTNADTLSKDKRKELLTFIDDNQLDVVAITEIFPKASPFENAEEIYNITGYDHFMADKKEGRGIIIYVNKNLGAINIEVVSEFKESVWVVIHLIGNDKILIGCVYRSPNKNTPENVNALLHLLNTVYNSNYTHILTMGDFNFPGINWNDETTNTGVNHIDNIFLEGIKDLFLHQHIIQHTRIRNNQQPTTLDLVFTNEENMVDNVEYLQHLGKSDHLILMFNFNCYVDKNYNMNKKYKYHKGNYLEINNKLKEIEWDVIVDMGIQNAWDTFTEKLHKLMEKHIPRSAGITGIKRNPYVDKRARDAIKSKRTNWIKYTNCKTPNNFETYKTARNNVTYEIRRSHQEYERNLAENVRENPKKFWKYVRSNTKTSIGVGKLTKPDGSITLTDKETANTLNTYFLTVFTRENPDDTPRFAMRTEEICETIQITEEKIDKLLNDIKTSKSPGPDNIHPILLKECAEHLKIPITEICKISMKEGKVPYQWKEANVTPIFKAGQKNKPENYRPISVTCLCCRLMERLIRDALVKHMESNNLISNVQHGFRKKHSCVTQLLECIEDWTEAYDNGHEVDIIYLDFRAAFDKVPHKRLIEKLKGYGITGKILSWIEDFLKNRKQRVVINGELSDWGRVESGVPQGSVLGPVLFLIFINDLPNTMKCTVKLFADDTKLYSILRNNEEANNLQDDVFRASEWANLWNLEFNAKKCKTMHIGKSDGDDYFIKNNQGNIEEISKVKEEKDLGVRFDSELKFKQHIGEKIKLANRNLGLICKTFTYMTEQTLMNLYKALVRPHLEYATPIWYPRYKKDKIAVENVQRRATKMVKGIRHYSYSERLRKLGLPSLEYRRDRADMIQVYRIQSGYDSLSSECFFPKPRDQGVEYNLPRGNSKKIYKGRVRTDLRANAFSQRVVNSWNSLPENVVSAPSINAFKSRLNTHWVGGSKFNPVCYQ